VATLENLKTWIERDIRPRRWTVAIIEDADRSFHCEVTAGRHVFTIAANADDYYLGCTCRSRFNARGETHPRFADLPDGSLNTETWEAIVTAMKRLEIRPYRGHGL